METKNIIDKILTNDNLKNTLPRMGKVPKAEGVKPNPKKQIQSGGRTTCRTKGKTKERVFTRVKKQGYYRNIQKREDFFK